MRPSMLESHKTGAQSSAIALESYSRCVRLVAKPKLGKIENNKPVRCIFRGSATDTGMIIQAILEGRQPPDLRPNKLLVHLRLPRAWGDQRIVRGFG